MRVVERRTVLERAGTQVHFPFLVESGTGVWYMTYREGPHGVPGGDRVRCVMSEDSGVSWQPWAGLDLDSRLRLFCSRLSDGSLISHRYHIDRNADGDWLPPILRSHDEGASWILSESPVVDMPYNRECENHCLWGHIREGRDGELLCGSYGQTGDTPGAHGRMRYTNGVLVSHDLGETWDFLGAVAAEPSLGNEGPNELDLLILPDGEMLSVFRTGTRDGSTMQITRSLDGGRNWSASRGYRTTGVSPQLILLQCGAVVCTYGTRDVHAMVLADLGTLAWHEPLLLYEGRGSGYTDLQALSPDTFRVVYDESTFSNRDESGPHRVVRVEIESSRG